MSKESNEDNGVDIELWNKVIEKNKNEEPCCDENNECCCNTFSPYMASPEDVKRFVDTQEFRDLLKRESDKQSWKRKLRNRYLGYKYRFEDWIYKIRN